MSLCYHRRKPKKKQTFLCRNLPKKNSSHVRLRRNYFLKICTLQNNQTQLRKESLKQPAVDLIPHYFSGNFTVLTATFEFKRRVGYYLLQVYLPCAILVMLSWIAFWMDKQDTGNRLTVGVTTILTIMFLLSYGNSSVPKMSYVKAMDIYLLSSFAFIFFSLIESVLCWRFDSIAARHKENNKVCIHGGSLVCQSMIVKCFYPLKLIFTGRTHYTTLYHPYIAIYNCTFF